ncbi:MAG: glucose-6-phosphate isomerase [Mycoplasmataceae bacterium]|nr:glucose-6-phosphate isomerase [Mycoplasmataceae bacterium]
MKRYQTLISSLVNKINLKLLDGSDMMGWLDLVDSYDSREIIQMRNKANEWKKMQMKYVLVIGIGGSYVGVRAAIDMCCGLFNEVAPKIIWMHNMSSTYVVSLTQKLAHEKFGIIVISKSGTTLEPAITFRIFRELLQKNVGISKLHKYIVAITDKNKGTLHDFAKHRHITTFGIPDDIGGRFSTLTPVGMFAIILKGLDPLMILKGAKQAVKDASNEEISENSAFTYACYRHYFSTIKHFQIENFIVYDPSLQFVGEMWRQIFAESEGKEYKGLFPTLSLFTTDLHSMGQYLQQGKRIFFETSLIVKKPKKDLVVKVTDNVDKLKYLNNKSLDFINKKAFEGTISAHTKIGKVNNFVLEIGTNDEYHFGYLFMWFAIAVTMSGYLLKINPFNQPGVEQYKSNMFKLLGKKH